jgi:capsular exopolysaccharide synthesis family protein
MATNFTERGAHNRSKEKAHFLASFHRYKSLLARKWWIPALCVVTGLVSVWSLSWYGPPTFVSVGRMIVSTKLATQETSAYSEEMNNFLGTQANLMQSDQVVRRALSRLAMDKRYRGAVSLARRAGAPVKLKVTITPKTSIFVLTGTGHDPQVTQTFVQYCMEEFMAVKGELRTRSSDVAMAGLGTEVERLEKTLAELDQAQMDFETTNSMALFEEQGNSIGNYLAALNQRLAALISELDLLQSLSLDQSLERWQQMGTALPIVDDLSRYGNSTPVGSSSVSELATDYLRAKQQMLLLKADQKEMGQYLQSKHPKMIAMDEEIARHQILLDIYREQGIEQLESRTNSLALQIKNLQREVKEWNLKALDTSKKLAEYHRLKAKSQRFESIYDHMVVTMESLDVNKETTPESMTIMERASSAEEGRPSLGRLMGGGGLVGLILGISMLMLMDRMDDRMASATELQEVFDEEVLAQIPRERSRRKQEIQLLMPDDTRHSYVESYRNLRSSLLYMTGVEKRPKTLLLTSSVPNDGKSVTASNLSITVASSGSRVLLVDADLRKGILHHRFDLPSGPGLCEVLSQKQSWKEAVVATRYPNLWLMRRGAVSHQSSELFLSPTMDKMIEEVSAAYDFVIFDTAPVMAADDVTSLAPQVDGVVFVVRADHTSARVAQAALQLLYQRQVRVLGMVFNAVRPRSGDYYYYYKYKDYYKAYPASGDGQGRKRDHEQVNA